ncbi:ribonuclease P protein component [Polynucleobacter paneuropaeus]|nr:ribonuclease P protein component [Polynucleobacter paneuropaeus]
MNSARISELLKTRPKTSSHWGVYSAPPKAGCSPDLGLAVAKKLAKRAVDRNRLKRMLREQIRKAQPGLDVVVKLRTPIGRETRGRLRSKEKGQLRNQLLDLV